MWYWWMRSLFMCSSGSHVLTLLTCHLTRKYFFPFVAMFVKWKGVRYITLLSTFSEFCGSFVCLSASWVSTSSAGWSLVSSAGGVFHRMFLCVWFSFFSYMYPSFSKKEPVHSMLEDILQLSGSVHLFAQAIGVPQFLDGQQRFPTLTAAGTKRYWTGSLVLALYLLMRLGS